MADGRDKQREETRRRLYQAALEVFRRDGVAACRIDDIAQKVGVSRGSFYFHFPTKDDVLVARLRESEAVVAEHLAPLEPDAPFEQVLEATAAGLTAAWEGDPRLLPEVATVALRQIAGSPTDRDAEPVRALLAPRFAAAAERGELSGVLPPEVLSDFYLSNMLAAMLAWVANPGLGLATVLGGVNQLFLRGVARPA